MNTLYVVATPIGNLEDLSLRALRILKEVDLIACEDTRRTRVLLQRYEIDTTMVSYHQHSKLSKIDWLVQQLEEGKDIALVTDAGTPGINDPGGTLVAAARAAGLTVVPIPGANTVATLLSVSGQPVDRYIFLGYLPKKKGRQTLMTAIGATMTAQSLPILFYESPERVGRTLQDWLRYLSPTATVTIGRELTKQFEEITIQSLSYAAEAWKDKRGRGEFVIMINPD